MAYRKKGDQVRVCRNCGMFFIASPRQHSRMHCFRDECMTAEVERANALKKQRIASIRQAPQLKVKKERAEVYELNVKIRKKCLQCGHTYWDYGNTHFGRCPDCVELGFYGEADYGTM